MTCKSVGRQPGKMSHYLELHRLNIVPIMRHPSGLCMEDTEEQIIGRLRDSDEKAFRLLFEKYQPMLFRIVLHRLGDSDAAHDIVQETFVRLWDHRGSLRPSLHLLAYLLRISTNLVYDRAKHLNVRSRL